MEVARDEEGDENEEYAFGKDSVLAAIEAVREGKCVVVTDDEGRENEGDLVFAAEKVIARLLRLASCLPVSVFVGTLKGNTGLRHVSRVRLACVKLQQSSWTDDV